MSGTARTLLAALACAALLYSAGPALAAPPSSQLTNPNDGSVLLYDAANPGATLTVDGTTSGFTNVDLNCYSGTSYSSLAQNVTLPWTGDFASVVGTACVLRAVPTGDTNPYPPGSATSFAGVKLYPELTALTQLSGSSLPQNNGTSYDWYSLAAFDQGSIDAVSAGSCGVLDSFVNDPVTLARSNLLINCAAALFAEPNNETRSGILVDGKQAWTPYSAKSLYCNGSCSKDLPGLPSLSFNRSRDGQKMTVTSTEPIVECAPDPGFWGPSWAGGWPAACSSFTSAGVSLQRTLVVDSRGRRASVTDRWVSTDAQPHALDLIYDNMFSSASADNSFKFAGESGFSLHPTGDVVTPPAGEGSVFIKGSDAAPDGDLVNPQGALSYSDAPDSAKFLIGTTPQQPSGSTDLAFYYQRSVPAGGARQLSFFYNDAPGLAEVAALALDSLDSLGIPSLSVANPAQNPSSVSDPDLTLSGSVTDNQRVAAVTVNGKPATISGTSWSLPVTLAEGSNRFRVIATDGVGNTDAATISVSYQPPSQTAGTGAGQADSGNQGTGATPPPPPIKATLAHTRKPRVSGKRLKLTLDTGLTLTCGTDSDNCSGSVKLLLPGQPVAAQASVALAPGSKQAIKLRLSKRAARLLRRAGSRVFTVQVELGPLELRKTAAASL